MAVEIISISISTKVCPNPQTNEPQFTFIAYSSSEGSVETESRAISPDPSQLADKNQLAVSISPVINAKHVYLFLL